MVRKKPPKGCPLPMPADLRHFVEGRLDRCLEMDNLKVGFGCKEYAHISAATPPTCSGSCRNCSNQYLPLQWQNLDGYSEQLTDDEAREMIRQFTAKTRVDLAYIRESLSTYGNAIVKRWQKRNTEKRAALLRKAMPEIYKDKWLEARSCDGFRTYSVFTSADVPARKCWLLPYVNVEALSQDWTKILALMHARVTYEPADWIAHDIDCQQHGFDSAWLDVGYNPHCVVVEASGFGQLTQWGMERAHKWEIMGFPRARLAFEAQSELSGFLSTMIKLLLGETGNQTPQGNSQWLALATTDFDDSTSGAIADSAYYNRAFSAPYRFDAGRIMNLLRARCDAAKDELWMLQRDPRHFRERLACAQATPYYRQLPQREKKRHLVRQTLSPVDHVHITQSVVEEVSLLIDVLNAHGGKSGQSVPLSKDCENVLRLLSGTFAGQFMTQVTALYEMTIQSSAFQHHISRDADGEVQYLTSPADAFRTDKLFWNIMKLGEVNLCSTHKPAFHLAYIDELLGKGSGPERERIGRVLYDHLSDMACVDECLTIVQSYRPCLGPFPNKETPLVLGLKYGLVQQVGVLEKLLMSWDALDSAEVLLQEPLEEFLVLPMPSTKANRETLMRTEELHHALYKYWTALTTYKRKNLKRLGFQEQDAARLVKSTSMGSTDEYRRGLAEELDGLRSAVEAKGRRRYYISLAFR